ncbi:MAG: hypothetical protein FWC42_09570 [Proteobacteria bacterium]|nr:hypothetical protein [Pseudomonadota bacterium]
MSTNEWPSLTEALDSLRRLDDSSIDSDKTTTRFLEVRKDQQGQGICISGNRAGLVRLTRLILEVAQKGFPGAHQHFDEIGELDFCEAPLVVSFQPADWDA